MESSTMEVDLSDVRNIELSAEIEAMVTKIRNTAKFFRKSPVSNDALQACLKADLNKCYQMILDVKTRW